MSKNTGHFLAFNREWFERNQGVLLWFLNAPVLKYWARWVLRLHRDVPFSTNINRIEPNAFWFDAVLVGDELTCRVDFRTHPKFGKRIYFSFRLVWWVIHFWDWAVADRFLSEWSYGFDTLTRYPDADPESTTVDGVVVQGYTAGSGQSWATIRAAGGTDSNDSTPAWTLFYIQTDSSPDTWRTLRRSIFLFNTTALGTGHVTAATLSIFGVSKSDPSTAITPDINIVSSAPASNTALAAGDFDSLGATAFATAITYDNWSTTGYNDFVLNASGLANIIAGVSKFGARNGNYDLSGTVPTGTINVGHHITGNFADQSGDTQDPKLVVTYTTVVGPANVKTYKGLASASVKTVNGLALASVKTWNGLN